MKKFKLSVICLITAVCFAAFMISCSKEEDNNGGGSGGGGGTGGSNEFSCICEYLHVNEEDDYWNYSQIKDFEGWYEEYFGTSINITNCSQLATYHNEYYDSPDISIACH